jgi:hypothetical protein
MRFKAASLGVFASFALLIPVCGFSPASAGVSGAARAVVLPDLVVTAAPVYEPLAALKGAERFPQGAQLLLIHDGKAEPLVAGFASSADASVSFDGKTVLFAGKQAAGDPWQIWELTLADRSVRRVLTTATDAIRPLYLPAAAPVRRMVYALATPRGFQLQAARVTEMEAKYASLDPGPANLQISYLPASAVPADVLADGRILFEAGFPLGSGSTPELFLVYSDGSGVESYRCDHGTARWGGRQLASGDVVFTHGGSLARFTSPLAHEAPVAAPRAEYAGGLAETEGGDWLVSVRAAAGAHYALKLWKPGAAALTAVFGENGKDIVEPVIAAPHKRPNRHPSGLHDWDYANMMALDSRQSRAGDLKAAPASVRLETLDTAGRTVVTGTSPVDADGSFFVSTPADKPIRFVLLDSKGAVVRQEKGWFWIRRGEQRICVGCHTGPERASENRVPAVLMRTTTPFDLTGVKAVSAQQQAPGGN